MPPQIFTFEAVSAAIEKISPLAVVKAMADGFRLYSAGRVSVAPIQTLGQPPLANFVGHPDAQACIKSAYENGGDYFVSKVASGGGGLNSGLVMVFSQRTFAPEAIILDEGHLTELRTAAAGALAAQQWAPAEIGHVAMIGCGIQARWQLKTLGAVVKTRRLRCWARRREQADEYASEMRKSGWDVEVASSAANAVDGAGLVLTTTPARQPILKKEDIAAGKDVTLICVGADSPGKHECDASLVASAALVVCDSVSQCVERGEVQHAVAAGLLRREALVECGSALSEQPPRRRPPGLVIFDSTGVAIQDVKMAELALDVLRSPAGKL